MDRRTFINTTVAAAVGSRSLHPRPMRSPSKQKMSYSFMGFSPMARAGRRLFHDCKPKGIHATAVQNPLTSLQAAVEATQHVSAWQQGPTVLAAHSFGGMILTEVGVDPKVSAVVYVAARAPDAGEDYPALAARFPTPPATAGIVWSDDWGRLSEEAFLRDFAGDLPADKARALYAVQAPFKKTLLADKTTHAAWRSKPSWYAVSKEDRTINPDLERFMAKRMGAKTIEVKASHLSLLSQPDAITNLILEAAGQT
jgi:pimeloyl-ACP methyl ester carboxylesterase